MPSRLRVAARSEGLRRGRKGRGPESLLTRNAQVSEQQARRTVRSRRCLERGAGDALGADNRPRCRWDTSTAFTDPTRRASPTGRATLVARQQALAGLAATQSPEEFAHSCHRVTVLADADGGLGEFERQRRSCRLRRFVDEASGMFKLSGQFDPELGVRVWRAIDHTVAVDYQPEHRPETTPEGPEAADHLAALALADVISVAYHDVDKAPQDPSEPMCRPPRGEFTPWSPTYARLLMVCTSIRSSRSIPAAFPLPVETLRRLACEADLLPVVLDGHGVAVDVGRYSSASPPPTNAARCERCTRVVRSLSAVHRSTTARSTAWTPSVACTRHRPDQPRRPHPPVQPPSPRRPRRPLAARTRPHNPTAHRRRSRRPEAHASPAPRANPAA